MKRSRTVHDYIRDATHWQTELKALREILLSCDLTEEVKWGAPCYTYKGKNVVGLGSFKSYFGLWFHQGVLLKDENNVQINAQEDKTKALRRSRGATAAFKSLRKGLQREYAEYISSARRDETRQKRIDKVLPMITAGIGLNDKYRR